MSTSKVSLDLASSLPSDHDPTQTIIITNPYTSSPTRTHTFTLSRALLDAIDQYNLDGSTLIERMKDELKSLGTVGLVSDEPIERALTIATLQAKGRRTFKEKLVLSVIALRNFVGEELNLQGGIDGEGFDVFRAPYLYEYPQQMEAIVSMCQAARAIPARLCSCRNSR